MLRIALIGLLLTTVPASAQQARQLLNGVRAEQGLPPLAPAPRLEGAAMAHAVDMVENGFFSHDGSDGSTVGSRARDQGYGWCRIAENIAQGQDSVHEVMRAWVTSPGHRRNILLPDITDYGLVRGQGDIWVLVLGRDGC